MEKIFDVKAIIIDKANNDKKTYFFVHNDTIANSMKIFQLKDGLIDEGKETNLGDFVADAYRFVLDTDISIVNGGSIRNTIKKGVFTYND
ncbi:MAG: 5'-nucleotidase C-terminal domain-containing protein, partial [Erysipelotrichaceae bacterium]|nr:5'-nucleotidase C-terminal domain-containing protein [Erysipelotrichaceae bacterium]